MEQALGYYFPKAWAGRRMVGRLERLCLLIIETVFRMRLYNAVKQ